MKKLSWILIIIGICIMLTPVVGNIWTAQKEKQLMEAWENSPDIVDPAPPEEAAASLSSVFDEEKSAEPDAPPAQPPKKEQKVLGKIEISKIKVNLPIVEGVESHNLKVGIGHLPGTAGLGQKGNCALAGHRSYTFGRFFNRLDELEIGDSIVVTTKEDKYIYKVYDKLVVVPEDLSVLKKKGNDSILTLITCTPVRVATHRLIIHAKLDAVE